MSNLTPTASADPVLEPHPGAAASSQGEWARLWFTLLEPPEAARVKRGIADDWRSLALVPAQPGRAALDAAYALAGAARAFRGRPVHVLDATTVPPADVPAIVHELQERARDGVRVLVAAESPLAHAAAIPLARSADAALLCVALGGAGMADARRTVDVVGRTRFLGAITLAP